MRRSFFPAQESVARQVRGKGDEYMKFVVIVYDDISGRQSGNAANPNGRHFVFKDEITTCDAKEDTLKNALQNILMSRLNMWNVSRYSYINGEYFGSSWGVTTLFAHVKINPNDYKCFVINV